MRKGVLAVLWCFINVGFAQTLMTKVIELHYVPADKVQQLAQPLIQPARGEAISSSGQTLVVRVMPQTLTTLRELIHKMDVAPVTFQISVYQGPADWLSTYDPKDEVYSTQSQALQKDRQSVRVMSGASALIATDQQVPIVSAVGGGWYPGIGYEQHTVHNGLLVQPTLQGAQVRLAIKRLREQQNPVGQQTFDNQQVDTTVMAPLNKWVALGSTEGAEDNDSSVISYSAGQTFTQNATLYIKVSLVGTLPAGSGK